jgi:glycosyltransferase involved in cell wall biosynthesis
MTMKKNSDKIDSLLASKILFLGIDYKNSKGGIAAVEKMYAIIFSPFRFVRTVVQGTLFLKFFILMEAIFRFFYYMIFKKNIRIIHIHGASKSSFYRKRIFIYASKLFNKKVVYHMHGGGFEEFALKHPAIVKNTLKQCDAIVVLSNSWKNFFVNELECKNVYVVKNVIDYPICSSISKSTVCTLLFLGLLCKEKGLYDLLEVISENKDAYVGKLIFRFAGNGKVVDVVNTMKRLKIDDIAFYEGWASNKEKIRLLNDADVYILPSYYEGLPISILEAMSYHLPIISTNVGGIPEIVKNGVNGFIVKPRDKEGLKKAIDQLLSDTELRKKMGEASSTMVKEYFPDAVERQLRDLYIKILSDK